MAARQPRSTSAQTLPPKPAPNAEAAQRAVLACQPRQRDGFRHLIAKPLLCQLLRASDSAPEAVEVAALSADRRLRHELACSPRGTGRIDRAASRSLRKPGTEPSRRVARRCEWRRPASSSCRPVSRRHRVQHSRRVARGAVVVVAGLTGLARGDAADADRKCQIRRARRSTARGASGRTRTDPGTQAGCRGSPCDPRCRPRSRRQPSPTRPRNVLPFSMVAAYAARSSRAVADVFAPRLVCCRAGSLEPGRGARRSSARSSCSCRRPTAGRSRTRDRRRASSRESCGTARRDHRQRVRRPADVRARRRPDRARASTPRPMSVQRDAAVAAWCRDDVESSLGGADEAAAAAVVGVLAEDFDRGRARTRRPTSSRSVRSRPSVATAGDRIARRARPACLAAEAGVFKCARQVGRSHDRALRSGRRVDRPTDAARPRRCLRAATGRARRLRPESRGSVLPSRARHSARRSAARARRAATARCCGTPRRSTARSASSSC